MENKITLYKVKDWTYNSLNQPYFLSDASRNTYFSSLEKIEPELKEPIIRLDFNLEVDVKVNLDITVVEQYNFAIIRYSNINYYCNIIDQNYITKNYSRIQLGRHLLSEKTNYFQHFTNFNVSKASFNQFMQSKNAKTFIPNNLRFFKEKKSVDLIWVKDSTHQQPIIDFIPCYIIYTNGGLGGVDKETTLYGESVQYEVYILPLYYYSGRKLSIGSNEVALYTNKEYRAISRKILNHLSPHIISLTYTEIPVTVGENEMHYRFPYFGTNILTADIGSSIGPTPMFNIQSTRVSSQLADEFFYFQVNKAGGANVLYSDEIFFNTHDNSIKIDHNRYSNGADIQYNVLCKMYLSVNGTELLCKVRAPLADCIEIQNETPPNIWASEDPEPNMYSFNLGDSTSFTVDQASTWTAENKYYDALTKNANSQRAVSSGVQTFENVAVGVSQLGFGAATGNMGQTSLGVGNLIRGVTEPMKGANDIIHHSAERELLAKQEKEKPSKTTVSGSAAIRLDEMYFPVQLVCSKPYPEDLKYFKQQHQIYGIDTFVSREHIDILEFTVNGYFFLAAIAEKNNTMLTTREYNILYQYLSEGHRYKII